MVAQGCFLCRADENGPRHVPIVRGGSYMRRHQSGSTGAKSRSKSACRHGLKCAPRDRPLLGCHFTRNTSSRRCLLSVCRSPDCSREGRAGSPLRPSRPFIPPLCLCHVLNLEILFRPPNMACIHGPFDGRSSKRCRRPEMIMGQSQWGAVPARSEEARLGVPRRTRDVRSRVHANVGCNQSAPALTWVNVRRE